MPEDAAGQLQAHVVIVVMTRLCTGHWSSVDQIPDSTARACIFDTSLAGYLETPHSLLTSTPCGLLFACIGFVG